MIRTNGGYCLVKTPLGMVGWVHRTTLEDPARGAPASGVDDLD